MPGISETLGRHEIENYLLAPPVVLELFADYRRTVPAAWVQALPATEADVTSLLQGLAAPFLPTHAAEILKEELLRQVNAAGGLGFGPRRPSPSSGAQAAGQAQWLAAFHQEAARLCQACDAVRNLTALQPAAITARYSALLAQIQDPVFLTSGEFLLDLDGHRLLGALARELSQFGPRITQEDLADQLLQAAERIYRPDHLYQPDDFAELARILAAY